jgi:hypothetical protein
MSGVKGNWYIRSEHPCATVAGLTIKASSWSPIGFLAPELARDNPVYHVFVMSFFATKYFLPGRVASAHHR